MVKSMSENFISGGICFCRILTVLELHVLSIVRHRVDIISQLGFAYSDIRGARFKQLRKRKKHGL